MNLIASIKYKYDNEQNDRKMKLIIWTVIIGLILLLISYSAILGILLILIIIAEIVIIYKPDGIVNLYTQGEELFLQRDQGKKEKISSHKFRWSYNFVEAGATGGEGGGKGSHASFVFTRVEFYLENNETIIIGRESFQWGSIPQNWQYDLYELPPNTQLKVTSYNLDKLKKLLEKQSFLSK